jgi:uncharacterized membrane protein YccC
VRRWEDGPVPDRSPAADLGFSDALNTRTRGFGSLSMVVRIAVATTISYFVAVRFSSSVLPIFAPATTMLVVQSSAFSTLGMLGQRVLGTGLGVAAATLYVTFVPITWWSVLLAVTAALLVARALPVGLVGQLQLPVAVVFVIALGAGDLTTDLWRVVDVIIGGAIGVIAVFVAPPRPRVDEARTAVDTYLRDIAAMLRAAADELGTHAVPLPSTTRHAFITDARSLLAHVGLVGEAMAEATESVRFNPRGRRRLAELEALEHRRLWATVVATQARALAGSLDRLYDRAGEAPVCPPSAMSPLVRALADLLDAAGAPPGQVALSAVADPRADPIAIDAALADDLRAAIAVTTERHSVVQALDSITALGRLDGLRDLIAKGPRPEEPLADLDTGVADAEDLLGPGERLRRLLRRD